MLSKASTKQLQRRMSSSSAAVEALQGFSADLKASSLGEDTDDGKGLPVVSTHSVDSCKEFEFEEESVSDEFLLFSEHVRELQYHDLRYLKNQVGPHTQLTSPL